MEPALYLKFFSPSCAIFWENFLGEFGSKSISGPMGFSPWPPDTEICKGTFVHPPDQRYPGVKIRITEAMLDGALYAFFGEHLNS